MAKKKEVKALKPLAPRLPSEIKELEVKGFGRNCGSPAGKFITDGHSLVLKEFVVAAFPKRAKPVEKKLTISDERIAALWNQVADRKHVAAQFIGCGKIVVQALDDHFDRKQVEEVLACLKDGTGRLVIVNPWKLAWVIKATDADTITVAAGKTYSSDPVAICRGTTMVGLLMPMRYSAVNLKEWDLNSAPVPLDKAFTAKPIR
jgi:hypothetical protein